MKTRSLFENSQIGVTVANPRVTVLASPMAFDADVLGRVVEVAESARAPTVSESVLQSLCSVKTFPLRFSLASTWTSDYVVPGAEKCVYCE